MGRVTKLTPELQSRIVQAIEVGNFASIACQAVGIGESTYYLWLDRGRREAERQDAGTDDHPIDPDPTESVYLNFMEAVRAAEAKAEVRSLALIQQAAATDARHAEWYLERKHPNRWGRSTSTQVEVSGPGGGPVQSQVAVVDPRDLLLGLLSSDDDKETEELDGDPTGVSPTFEQEEVSGG